jgi:hypothetical protein
LGAIDVLYFSRQSAIRVRCSRRQSNLFDLRELVPSATDRRF